MPMLVLPPCATWRRGQAERRITAVVRREHHNNGAHFGAGYRGRSRLRSSCGCSRRRSTGRYIPAGWCRECGTACPCRPNTDNRARPHRIIRAGGTNVGTPRRSISPLVGMPGRPLGHRTDLGNARPRHGLFADGDAIADRLAAIHHVVEVVIVGIDHDRTGGFLALVFDDGAAESIRRLHILVANLRQQFLVVLLECGGVGRLIGLPFPCNPKAAARWLSRPLPISATSVSTAFWISNRRPYVRGERLWLATIPFSATHIIAEIGDNSSA